MGPGHFGVALAVKQLAPKAPLWALLLGSEAIDLLCFGLMALEIEKGGVSQASIEKGIQMITPGVIPWSHGLPMAIIWSVLAAALTFLFLRDRRAAAVLGGVVFSHWLLDFLVHLPDLPLAFTGSPKLGLGLWGSGPGLVVSGVLEVLLIVSGLVIYLRWRRSTAQHGIKTALHPL